MEQGCTGHLSGQLLDVLCRSFGLRVAVSVPGSFAVGSCRPVGRLVGPWSVGRSVGRLSGSASRSVCRSVDRSVFWSLLVSGRMFLVCRSINRSVLCRLVMSAGLSAGLSVGALVRLEVALSIGPSARPSVGLSGGSSFVLSLPVGVSRAAMSVSLVVGQSVC